MTHLLWYPSHDLLVKDIVRAERWWLSMQLLDDIIPGAEKLTPIGCEQQSN
jgi:hypothetical protein